MKIDKLTSELGITHEEFSRHTGIECRHGDTQVESGYVQATDIYEILTAVLPWFDGIQESWHWFISTNVSGFGGLTPAEVVKQEGGAGIDAVKNFIDAKKAGGFA